MTTTSFLEMQAEICKTFTNPKRIEILNSLKRTEKTTSELVSELGTTKSNISQHLKVMKLKGILITRRDGINVYYRVANTKIIEAGVVMKELLCELQKDGKRTAAAIARNS